LGVALKKEISQDSANEIKEEENGKELKDPNISVTSKIEVREKT